MEDKKRRQDREDRESRESTQKRCSWRRKESGGEVGMTVGGMN